MSMKMAYFIYIFEYEVDFLFATISLFEVHNELARSQIVQHFELSFDKTFTVLFETFYGNELLGLLVLSTIINLKNK